MLRNRPEREEALDCRRVGALLGAYLEEGLPRETKVAVRTHLDSCPACRQAADEEAALASRLRLEAARQRRRLSSETAAHIQEQGYQRMRRAIMVQRVSHLAWGVTGAAAVILLAVGIYAYSQRPVAVGPVPQEGDQLVVTFACMDHERSQYENLIESFQRDNPGIRIQLVSANEASGMQSEGNTVTTDGQEVRRLAAAADTFAWYAGLRPADWAYLLDLRPFVDDPSFPADDFYPGTLDRFRWQGGLYGLPARVLPFVVFYDKKVFDQAGLPYPQIGWTWDDLVAAATQLTERQGDEVSRYGFVDDSPRNTVLSMVQAYGISLWDDRTDPPRPLFDSPQLARAVHRYADLALTFGVMPAPEIGSNLMTSELLNQGKAAMWTGFAFDREWHARRTDLGLAPYPEGVAAANPSSLYGFFISAGTAQPDAAWRWLSYLSANYQPALSDELPGRRSVGERLSWWRRLDKKTRAVYEYILSYPSVDDPMSQPLWTAVASVFREGTEIETALASAQAQALEMQAGLAKAAAAVPEPVASPPPLLEEGQTLVRFAPVASADTSLYRELAAGFGQDHPGVRVEIVAHSTSLEELVANTDCFAAPASLAADTAGVRQEILSLKPLLDADADFDLADFYPQFLEPVQEEGELWGLPYEADAMMVYIHLDRFAEGGVALPQPDWTIQDFLSIAAHLSQKEGIYGFTTREGAYGDLLFVLERLGAHLYDGSREPPTPTLDDPTVVAALGQYADLARGVALTPGTPSRESGWPDSIFVGDHPGGVRAGTVAMWVDSIRNHAAGPALSFATGVQPLPAGTGASTEFDVMAYYISARSPAAQACWAWLTFLSDRPEVVDALPARKSIADATEWQQQVGEDALPAYRATLTYGEAPLFGLRWQVPWLGYAYPWLDDAFRAAVAGQDVASALAEAQAKAEALVACLQASGTFSDPQRLGDCARQVDPDYP